MLVFAIAIVLFGLIKKQGKKFWIHGLIAIVIQAVVVILFNGGGTLENPAGDGIVTAMVRASTEDGPIMGVFALLVLTLGWGVPLWIVKRGYQPTSKNNDKDA